MPCQTAFRDDSSQVLLFKIASCLAEGGAVAGVASFNGRVGIVTLTLADVAGVADGRYVLKSGDSMTGALSINNGILAVNDPALELFQTWNNAAETFTGLLSNVTSTAAGANSLLFDFQLGGTSVLALQATGRLLLNGRAAFINTGSVGHILNTTDALNTAVVNVLTVGHSLSAGAAAAGFGSRIDMVGDSATVTSQTQLRVDSFWTDPVQATRTAAANFILPVSGSLVTHLTLTNNQAQLRDGTAALPSLTFQSDTNTGIYRIGADSFGSSAGGSVILATSTTGINLTDALAYQYNSVNVIRAQTALLNFFFGPSGNLTMTGANNTAIGAGSFLVNTTGSGNVVIGASALMSNTTGTDNTSIGTSSLTANDTGFQNVGIGTGALAMNSSGFRNVGIGVSSLPNNTTGGNNVAIGFNSLTDALTAGSNTAIGDSAMNSATTGGFNSSLGAVSLPDITTGIGNTAVGYNTGSGITTGNSNTIVGAQVAGLAAALSNNIILADGAGVIRLQIDSSGNTTLAGTVATAAGTAALPAHTFSADLNTGLYNIGADSLGLSTGGTLRVTTNTTDLILATAFRLAMASGANTRAGNAVLVGGTVTVANTSVTANTIVMLTRKTSGGTLGTAITYTVIAATSFTINSDSALDTSTFSYLLIENP